MLLRNHFHGPHFVLLLCRSLSFYRDKTLCGLDTSNSYPTQVTIEPLTIVRSPRGARGFWVSIGSQSRRLLISASRGSKIWFPESIYARRTGKRRQSGANQNFKRNTVGTDCRLLSCGSCGCVCPRCGYNRDWSRWQDRRRRRCVRAGGSDPQEH